MTRPAFYDPSRIGTMCKPNTDAAVQEGREYALKNNIKSSAADNRQKVILCLIDMQADFINPPTSNYPGNLNVPGAVGDADRVCNFIFNNVDKLSHIVASLDTHYLYQPFHRFNWIAGSNPSAGYKAGDNPNPFTLISGQDLDNDTWRPARLPTFMRKMIQKLEANAKKTLCIWPLHCELGTPGHALDPVLMETIHWHSGVRNDQYDLTEKGMSQLSEHYGILRAEVEFPEDPRTALNVDIINKWSKADRIYLMGEARTHCFLETVKQTVACFAARSPEVLERLFVLADCTSNVPDIKDAAGNTIVPFDQIATDEFKQLETMGVNFVNSTDPIVI